MASDPTISLRIRTALGEYLKRDPATILITQQLLYRIEEVFDLQIPDQDLMGLMTVGHVVSYVEKRVEKPSSNARTKEPQKPSKPKGKKKF
jgi:acyl carrier protein